MSEKKAKLVAKFRAEVRGVCDVRDKRDAALKVAAAALATLEATAESDTATKADLDAAEVLYEDQFDVLVELNTTLSASCQEMVKEGAGLFGRGLPDERAKAVLREGAALLYRSLPEGRAKA
jgi:hypothetical protein